MTNEKKISIALLAIGFIFIATRTFVTDHGMGKAYVKVESVKPTKSYINDGGINITEPYFDKNGKEIQWQKYPSVADSRYG